MILCLVNLDIILTAGFGGTAGGAGCNRSSLEIREEEVSVGVKLERLERAEDKRDPCKELYGTVLLCPLQSWHHTQMEHPSRQYCMEDAQYITMRRGANIPNRMQVVLASDLIPGELSAKWA